MPVRRVLYPGAATRGVYPDELAPLEVREPGVQKSGVEVSRGERGAPLPSVIPQNWADPIGHQSSITFVPFPQRSRKKDRAIVSSGVYLLRP